MSRPKAPNSAELLAQRKDRYYRKHKAAIGARKHGLSVDDVNAMLSEQGGVCAICRQPPADGQRLCVDHDHTCCPGQRSCGRCVRGLICQNCNKMLGFAGDSVVTLRAAVGYLS